MKCCSLRSAQVLFNDARLPAKHPQQVAREIEAQAARPRADLFVQVEAARILGDRSLFARAPVWKTRFVETWQAARAGGQGARFGQFESETSVPLRYRADARWDELSRDPARGGGVGGTSRKEAMAALEAERLGMAEAVSRSPKFPRIDFQDPSETGYDVKTPYWDLEGAARSIVKKALTQHQKKPVQVIVDITYLSDAELEQLKTALLGDLAQFAARASLAEVDRRAAGLDASARPQARRRCAKERALRDRDRMNRNLAALTARYQRLGSDLRRAGRSSEAAPAIEQARAELRGEISVLEQQLALIEKRLELLADAWSVFGSHEVEALGPLVERVRFLTVRLDQPLSAASADRESPPGALPDGVAPPAPQP